MRQNYAIFTKCGKIVQVVTGREELLNSITGQYDPAFGYISFPVLKEQAIQLRKELSERANRRISNSPRKIVLDCIADKRNKEMNEEVLLTDDDLLQCAYHVSQGDVKKLLDIADNIHIVNDETGFEENVVRPIKLIQGIYN